MIRLVGCEKIYSNNTVGLSDVFLNLPERGLVFLTGNSGSGKSTFINCLSGLDKFTNGKIYKNDIEVENFEFCSSFSFQENKLFENLTAIDNLLLFNSNETEIIDTLKLLKIEELAYKKVNEISGGQRARIGIARVLTQHDEILFFDEPLANLDKANSDIVMSALEEASKTKLVIISIHNNDEYNEKADAILEFADGRVRFKKEDSRKSVECNFTKQKAKNPKAKYCFKFAKLFLKTNLIKTITSFVLFLLSFTSLFYVVSSATIDKSVFMYTSFKNNNVNELIIRREHPEFAGASCSVTLNDIVTIKHDSVRYENAMFEMLNEDVPFGISTIEVNNSLGLLDCHAYLQTNESSSECEKFTYKTTDIFIDKIIENSSRENKLIINSQTFECIKDNIYMNNRVCLYESDIREIQVLNNYYYSYTHAKVDSIVIGNNPESNDEVAISEEYAIEKFGSIENALNQQISLCIGTATRNSNQEIFKDTYYFKVVGIYSNTFKFTESITQKILGEYGFNSLYGSNISLILNDYTVTDIRTINNNGLVVDNTVQEKINSIFGLFNTLKPFILIAGLIFAIISFFTLINAVSSTLNKFRKDIGILLSFRVKKVFIFFAFLLESLVSYISAFILSIPIYLIALNVTNTAITNNYETILKPLSFNPLFVAIIFISLFAILVLSIFVSMISLIRKRRIDVLNDK